MLLIKYLDRTAGRGVGLTGGERTNLQRRDYTLAFHFGSRIPKGAYFRGLGGGGGGFLLGLESLVIRDWACISPWDDMLYWICRVIWGFGRCWG